MSRWFRMYDELLDDPKVQRLPADDFRGWVNLLCLASRNNGKLPHISDIAFALRETLDAVSTLVERLRSAGLIERRSGGADGAYDAPYRWAERQYKSDTSTDRVKRFRQRSKQQEGNAVETSPDTETEADTEEKPIAIAIVKKTDSRGTRLPSDWEPSPFGPKTAAMVAAWPCGMLERELSKFRDYYLKTPGAKGRSLDWNASLRNWLTNADERKPRNNDRNSNPTVTAVNRILGDLRNGGPAGENANPRRANVDDGGSAGALVARGH